MNDTIKRSKKITLIIALFTLMPVIHGAHENAYDDNSDDEKTNQKDHVYIIDDLVRQQMRADGILLYAISTGDIQKLKATLQQGADVNAIKNGYGVVLSRPTNNHEKSEIKMVKKRVCPEGATALMIATQKNNLEIVRILLENQASVNATGRSGITPLMIAATEGYTDIVHELLNKNARLDKKDSNGITAIVKAVNSNHLDTAQILAFAGACLDNTIDKSTTLLSCNEHTYHPLLTIAQYAKKNIKEQDWLPEDLITNNIVSTYVTDKTAENLVHEYSSPFTHDPFLNELIKRHIKQKKQTSDICKPMRFMQYTFTRHVICKRLCAWLQEFFRKNML